MSNIEITAAEIKDALDFLLSEAHVDDHWNADGTPKVASLESFIGKTGLTAEQVEAAAPGIKRPVKKASTETTAPVPAPTPAEASVATVPQAAPAAPVTPAVKPTTPAEASVATVPAVDPLAGQIHAIGTDIDKKRAERDALNNEIGALDKQRDGLKEKSSTLNTEAARIASVRAVQQQGFQKAIADKEKMGVVAEALKAAGIKVPVYASPIDAAYAAGGGPMRQSRQENSTNMAKMIHQNNEARINERHGRV